VRGATAADGQRSRGALNGGQRLSLPPSAWGFGAAVHAHAHYYFKRLFFKRRFDLICVGGGSGRSGDGALGS
jgi:hypothetical protein